MFMIEGFLGNDFVVFFSILGNINKWNNGRYKKVHR